MRKTLSWTRTRTRRAGRTAGSGAGSGAGNGAGRQGGLPSSSASLGREVPAASGSRRSRERPSGILSTRRVSRLCTVRQRRGWCRLGAGTSLSLSGPVLSPEMVAGSWGSRRGRLRPPRDSPRSSSSQSSSSRYCSAGMRAGRGAGCRHAISVLPPRRDLELPRPRMAASYSAGSGPGPGPIPSCLPSPNTRCRFFTGLSGDMSPLSGSAAGGECGRGTWRSESSVSNSGESWESCGGAAGGDTHTPAPSVYRRPPPQKKQRGMGSHCATSHLVPPPSP